MRSFNSCRSCVTAFVFWFALPSSALAQVVVGATGNPARYQLLRADPGSSETLQDAVAAAFTPDLLRQLGRERPDLGIPTNTPVLLVAFRAFEPGRPAALLPGATLFAAAIPRGPLQLKDSVAALHVWGGTEFERLLRLPSPWPDIIAIAAFPMDLWRADVDFVFGQRADVDGRILSQYKHARIPLHAFAAWK